MLRPAASPEQEHRPEMATRIGAAVILAGICLLLIHAVGWVDGDAYDLGGVLAIVVGALGVAVDGEEVDAKR